MLSYAIALDVGTARVGEGIVDACPGLTAPGDTVAFLRNDYPGLAMLGGQSTAPAAIPGATSFASDPQLRLAADGRSLVYACPANGGVQICKVDADTGGVVQLTSDSMYTNANPDWSPGGDSIVFVRNGVVSKMTSAGTGLVQLSQTAYDVKWSRDGTRFAYASTADGGLHIVSTDGTGDNLVTTGFTDLRVVRWSPDGNSLVLVRQSDSRLWVVPVTGGTPSLLTAFTGNVTGGDWSAAGIILSLDFGSGAPSLWLIGGVDGPIYRVTRPTTSDRSPSWRRNP
jgi:dipeptidyl aminopeptidase/acylaminoacyl peptidase